jgi:hypothetical protein
LGNREPSFERLGGLGSSIEESVLEVFERRGFDEDEARRETRLLDLLHTLHVNVQHANLSLILNGLHGPLTEIKSKAKIEG